MRKSIILLLITLTVFLPPVSIYFALKSAETTRLNEQRDIQNKQLTVQLQEFDRSLDDSESIIREIRQLHEIFNEYKISQKSLTADQIEKFFHEKIATILAKFDFPMQVDCIIQSSSRNQPGRLVSFGNNLGLSQLSRRIQPVSPGSFRVVSDSIQTGDRMLHHDYTVSDKISADTAVCTQYLAGIYANCINEVYNKTIDALTIRSQNSCLLLTGENILSQIPVLALAEINNLTWQKSVMQKVKSSPHTDFGFGYTVESTGKTAFSPYFGNHHELAMQISELAKRADKELLRSEISGHDVCIHAYDRYKGGRLFTAVPSLKARSDRSQNMLIAVFFLLACMIFKILVEKIVLDRGPDLSIKVLLPATFLFLVIQPLFAAAFLLNGFFHSQYANEKSRVRTKLSSDLREIDMETLDQFRETLNLARSFDSIEKISALTGLEYKENEYEICCAVIDRLLKDQNIALFSSFWLSIRNRPFVGARWNPAFAIHERVDIDNPLTRYFHERFKEIINEADQQQEHQQQVVSKELQEDIKQEFSRDFFLKLLGPDSFYRFRQSSDIMLSLNTKFNKEIIMTSPVSWKSKLFALAIWHIGGETTDSIFPDHRINIDAQSPRLAFTGNKLAFISRKFANKTIVERFPKLFRIARLAHLSSTPIQSHQEEQNQSILAEAIPAFNSHHTIAGSEILQSYQQFCHNLVADNSTAFLGMLITGLILAFAGALYFTAPLRELTMAAYRIARGDFSCRIPQNHPDEFAAIGQAFNSMAKGLEEGSRLKSFVSNSVRSEVAVSDEIEIADRARTKHATIIFSSICRFTEYQRSHNASEVFALLQKHLQAADKAVEKFGGEIDKMIEDKIMIVFEHEMPDSKISQQAVMAAESILTDMRETAGVITGIGINTGVIVAGVMGAVNTRLSRTVVGDPVNLAARLAALATQREDGGMIAAQQIVVELPEGYQAKKLPVSKVKGKTQTIEAFILQKTRQPV